MISSQDVKTEAPSSGRHCRRLILFLLAMIFTFAGGLYLVNALLAQQQDRPRPSKAVQMVTLCQLRADQPAQPPAPAGAPVPLPQQAAPAVACPTLPAGTRLGVDCQGCPSGRQMSGRGWGVDQPIPWQALVQGEYVGPPRLPHVPRYLIRPGDQIEFLYRRKREMSFAPYKLNVGDRIRVESLTDEKINREVVIQLDGRITLPPALQVRAAGRTVEELTRELERLYTKWYKVPAITVTPVDTERRLQDLLESVDSRYGAGGLSQQTTVTPEGTVQLPGIGNVMVHGLTIDEVQREVEERYAQIVLGIGVTPRLTQIAPRFVYVGGEVRRPNRYTLEAPTSVIMAIAMAGGWVYGADLHQVVVFRRADDWHLMATTLDLHDALLGRAPCPDDIWLRDSDIVYLPKSKMRLRDDFLDLFFTQGLYRVIPINLSFAGNSTL